MKNSEWGSDERASIALRTLYQSYGYRPYKVSKFEEYDLYVRNKDFLTGDQILAFSDTNGRLMALKPDITLSVVKNTKDEDAPIKISYAENVYRVPKGAYGFREIMQTGVEYIGDVDAYAMGEILLLAAKSLETISESYALDIADMGVAAGILNETQLDESRKKALLAFVAQKNLHGLCALCDELDVGEKTKTFLSALITQFGPLAKALDAFQKLGLPQGCQGALADLRAIAGVMEACGVNNVNLDFSVVNDMNYYNGLVFTGFIDGIASGVLSGGRYDRLMKKMGRSSQAIGFAVYLDQLERFAGKKTGPDVDVLLVYGDTDDPAKVAQMAQRLTAEGERVRVQRGEKTALTYARMVTVNGGDAL